MPNTIAIADVSDYRIQAFANLPQRDSHRRDCDSFIVEGRMCVERLLQSDYRVNSVLIEHGKDVDDLRRLLASETPVFSLPTAKMRQLVGFNFHRGILACGERPQLPAASQLELGGAGPKIALALIGVSEQENLGGILRSAAAFGIDHILVGPKTIDPFARRTIRVSMGAVFKLRLHRLDRPIEQFAELQQTGNVRVVATTLASGATSLSEFSIDNRSCMLVVGNEAFGIDPEIQAISDDLVTIPMQMGIDSLNVSVASAICMFELAQAYGVLNRGQTPRPPTAHPSEATTRRNARVETFGGRIPVQGRRFRRQQ